ncbi:MAG: hypothetical protein PHS92_04555 [Candidatus Gracilibacteria bacterium]|nr:hypothetical protein [Candidatus Gracilibacteria bacterium]
MNAYFKVGWLSLVILFIFEIIVSSISDFKLGKDILIIFTLISLPLFNIVIQELKKDFYSLPLKFRGHNILKYLFLFITTAYIIKKGSFDPMESLIFSYFFFSVMFAFESRVSFLLALVFLSYCPIFLISDNSAAAENFAIFTYYFLCIGVVTQIIELKTNKKIEND